MRYVHFYYCSLYTYFVEYNLDYVFQAFHSIHFLNDTLNLNLELEFKKPRTKGNFKGDLSVVPMMSSFVTEMQLRSLLDNKSSNDGTNDVIASSIDSKDQESSSSSRHNTTAYSPENIVHMETDSSHLKSYSQDLAMSNNSPTKASLQSVASLPPMHMGWLKKEGHNLLSSITTRYFVLIGGVLSYYEKQLNSPPYGDKIKGKMVFKNATVTAKKLKNKYQLVVTSEADNKNKDITLEAESEDVQKVWLDALRQHIAYSDVDKTR